MESCACRHRGWPPPWAGTPLPGRTLLTLSRDEYVTASGPSFCGSLVLVNKRCLWVVFEASVRHLGHSLRHWYFFEWGAPRLHMHAHSKCRPGSKREQCCFCILLHSGWRRKSLTQSLHQMLCKRFRIDSCVMVEMRTQSEAHFSAEHLASGNFRMCTMEPGLQ